MSSRKKDKNMENKPVQYETWFQKNKGMVISLIVVLIYTAIMIGIIFGYGYSFSRCSSGSLTEAGKDQEEVELQTTMHGEA